MSNYALFSKAFSQTANHSIDAESGVILGVAVITEGPALGHTDFDSGLPMFADATTLEEVMTCASQFEGGLKVKMTHGGDAADIVGVLKNFRIEGPVLRADFRALKTTPHRDYIFEIAESMPHAFGLSIAFSGEREIIDDQAMARCGEIYSADLVSEPAANPNGLFTANRNGSQYQTTTHTSKMDEKELIDSIAVISEKIEEMGQRLSKLEYIDEPEQLEDEEKQMAEMPEADEPEAALTEEKEMAEHEEIAEMAAKAALKQFTKHFGGNFAPAPSREAANPASKQLVTFESLVADQVKEGKTKVEAIRYCATNHKAEHVEYENRVRSGELITL